MVNATVGHSDVVLMRSNQYVDLSLVRGAFENLSTLLKTRLGLATRRDAATQIGILDPFN